MGNKGKNKNKKKTKEKTKGAVVDKAPPLVPAKSVFSADHVKLPRRGGGKVGDGTASSIAKSFAANARAYAAGLADPFHPSAMDVRVPDLLTWPTATACLREQHSVTVHPDEAATAKGARQSFFTPVLADSTNVPTASFQPFYATRSTHDGSTYLTWAAGEPSVWASSLATQVYAYRTVNFGIRIHPTSKLADRNGYIRTGLAWSPFDQPTDKQAFSKQQTCRTISADSDEVEGLVVSWRPGDYVEALDFRHVTSGGLKGSLVFEMGSVTTSQTYDIEVIHNIEFIPWPSAAALFDLALCEGSESDTAMALAEVARIIGNGAASVTRTAGEVMQSAGPLWKLGKQALRIGMAAYGGGAGAAASAMMGKRPPVKDDDLSPLDFESAHAVARKAYDAVFASEVQNARARHAAEKLACLSGDQLRQMAAYLATMTSATGTWNIVSDTEFEVQDKPSPGGGPGGLVTTSRRAPGGGAIITTYRGA